MEIILSNFIAFFKLLGRKVVIISDMVRVEYGVKNFTAGVDLFLQIYNIHGLSNKAIARDLGISPRTVQHHTIHIYGKTGGSFMIEPIVKETLRELEGVEFMERGVLHNHMMKNVIDNSDELKLDKIRYKELLKVVEAKVLSPAGA